MEYFHIPLAHLSYGSHASLKALYHEVWVCMILSTEIHGDQTQDVCDHRVQNPKIFSLERLEMLHGAQKIECPKVLISEMPHAYLHRKTIIFSLH